MDNALWEDEVGDYFYRVFKDRPHERPSVEFLNTLLENGGIYGKAADNWYYRYLIYTLETPCEMEYLLVVDLTSGEIIYYVHDEGYWPGYEEPGDDDEEE